MRVLLSLLRITRVQYTAYLCNFFLLRLRIKKIYEECFLMMNAPANFIRFLNWYITFFLSSLIFIFEMTSFTKLNRIKKHAWLLVNWHVLHYIKKYILSLSVYRILFKLYIYIQFWIISIEVFLLFKIFEWCVNKLQVLCKLTIHCIFITTWETMFQINK